ncbi:TPA: Asp-tRNA(Asn)/Glu-tRNA(Gln) amidotransferase subunit GatA [Candidatus Berkelbacteria bacterium]|uniref:Glutamyl-tRNA(Gln) amidotransferase subunit A n=1 Tax=Berkelbacteria bacterium GW2011_GWE1_39_12 TaxID=1618337 RepID=A0A0G4B360_9BACT|nr:MAG: aspartyl/glutamyl-tRNA amidotransferase subunit A, aspartyl-tRNA(Asn)/glutamyl-tRNA (Gln) amidotransferase subunit A [Berkelbacteria bacterium GW2011_GWE1_39_12]HBO60592.1 Asp-tRNA(Asn)/Glu-tRNA(Gln) amidotransferase subunit GatA [Candidatus Berkelbacteria bacterium]
MSKELYQLTLLEASDLLKNEEITSVELTEAFLRRIENINPKIDAYLEVFTDTALKEAKESDERRRNGATLSEIDGCPIAVKDNLAMEGEKTASASKILENFLPPYNATVISKLKNAGVIILGKTNMDEFAMGSSTENSAFQVTKNPWDSERVPGGSSGGSAAAVAADLCLAALGSDTGGSIRQPASLCGVNGLKPTYGTVSRFGLFAMASSLDQIGPITKTAEDAKLLFGIINGYDEKDSTSLEKELTANNKNINDLRIGIPKEYFAEGLNPEVKKIIDESVESLKKLGAEIVDISLPNAKYALSCYYIIMPVEVSSNMARYDGIKYGFSAKDAENLIDTYFKSRSEALGEEVKRRIMLGTYTSSAGYIGKFYNKAQKVRSLIKQDFDNAFKEVDFILGPVSPTTAFKIGEKSDDPLAMYLSDIYTISVNLAGIPAMSVPAGLVNGLPVGLQVIGPQMSDLDILQLANTFESNRNELPRAQIQ